MNGDDELLMESLTVILTDTGFLEYVQEGTIAFVDEKLDDSDESQGTFNYLLKQQREFKYLQALAYEINPELIINDPTYQDFVDHEQNLVEMVDFLKENKDVDGVYYTEDVIELGNFIKSTQSTD
ncbi:MAG: hypothetical protein ISP88_14490 [Pseudomonadales bacterium]|nr:hypothetical protein [Pseudomonadales bacterium]|tara:strand:- start:813 stop:1187 length:375 start_codon:yes stop_codon:yes gene_type:complete